MDSLIFNIPAFTYENSSEPVFDKVSLQLYRGWTGLVGKSGAGKTTLARSIFDRCGVIVHFAEQRTDNPPKTLNDLLKASDKAASLLKRDLKIDENYLICWGDLSHGERKRVQIAAALYENPELLIVDEPTNHLDGEAKKFIVDALKRFDGFGLLISHDRELLDLMCDRILFIEDGTVDIRGGSYSIAAKERKKERDYALKLHTKHSNEIKKLKKLTQEQREKTEQSKKRISKRGLDSKDSDKRERIGRAIVSGKDARDTNTLSRFQSRLSQSKKKLQTVTPSYETGVVIEAAYYPNLFPIVLEDGRRIQARSRIGITGRNGSGKSRFVERFVKSREWSKNELLYLPQEIGAEESAALLKNIQETNNDEKRFFDEPDRSTRKQSAGAPSKSCAKSRRDAKVAIGVRTSQKTRDRRYGRANKSS
ncbi:MAG: ATP-binding cassette domain-containing protein [Helicobacteraceae bacterium]|jgi:ATPase subunit of ABC transporter with duplicated ATPase domains|nr:ATP-binding cassette domain-containing protein [Helicobacteraceae bacterium]